MARGRKSNKKKVNSDWEENLGWKARFYREDKGVLVGKQVGGFRIKDLDEESEIFLEWLEKQSNLSDAIRYLIEKDIIDNGIRDLAEFIPRKRTITETSNFVSQNVIKELQTSPVLTKQLVNTEYPSIRPNHIVSKENMVEESLNIQESNISKEITKDLPLDSKEHENDEDKDLSEQLVKEESKKTINENKIEPPIVHTEPSEEEEKKKEELKAQAAKWGF